MSDTYQTNCHVCNLEIDWISDGETKPICDDCHEEIIEPILKKFDKYFKLNFQFETQVEAFKIYSKFKTFLENSI